jgi:translation initiation factor IF-3
MAEVGGSNPPGSTSFEPLLNSALGHPRFTQTKGSPRMTGYIQEPLRRWRPRSINQLEVHDIKRGGKGREQRATINQQIQATQVRLIDVDGEQVGIVPLEEALEQATGKQLDLVEISPDAEPPVCRIMDYGKHLFEQKQKAKESRKKTRQTQLKEIKFRPGTDSGDYEVKLRNLKRFLEAGDKTKVTVRFRGREMAHQELGRDLLERVEADLAEHGSVEQRPNMEGRQMIMVLSPGSKKKK